MDERNGWKNEWMDEGWMNEWKVGKFEWKDDWLDGVDGYMFRMNGLVG